MKQMTELVTRNNEEILEQLFKDFRYILYTRRPLKVQLKMLYAARHAATYNKNPIFGQDFWNAQRDILPFGVPKRSLSLCAYSSHFDGKLVQL